MNQNQQAEKSPVWVSVGVKGVLTMVRGVTQVVSKLLEMSVERRGRKGDIRHYRDAVTKEKIADFRIKDD